MTKQPGEEGARQSVILRLDGIRAQYGVLAHAHRDLGKPLDHLRLGIQCITHVAPTDQEAREALKNTRWQNRAQRGLNRQDVTNGRIDATPYDGELDDEAFMNRLFFGSPETLIESLKRLPRQVRPISATG